MKSLQNLIIHKETLKILPLPSNAKKKSGHVVHPTEYGLFKENKHGNPLNSLLEFVAHKAARYILPEYVSDIRLIVDSEPELITGSGKQKIVGVEVERIEKFDDMRAVNVIELIAELEGFEAQGPVSDSKPELREKIRRYFLGYNSDQDTPDKENKELGKQRRLRFFYQYISIVFIRYLLQEDDGHKGNYGFSFDEENYQLKAYGVDFDMMFFSSILANLNVVRLSQWGSPFAHFKLTRKDLENFPDIKDSTPGHYPAIPANSWRAHSLTPNDGRTTETDSQAFLFLCKQKQEYIDLKKQCVEDMIGKFLETDVSEFEKNLIQVIPENLKKNENIFFPEKHSINFPHIFSCALAQIQVSLWNLLDENNTNKIKFNRINLFSDQLENYFEEFVSELNSLSVENKVNFLKRKIQNLENTHHFHHNENKMKQIAIEMFSFVAKDCSPNDLGKLFEFWFSIKDNFIVKSRNSNAIARRFKNVFYNEMTTTYVTIRDILLRRALQLRELELIYNLNTMPKADHTVSKKNCLYLRKEDDVIFYKILGDNGAIHDGSVTFDDLKEKGVSENLLEKLSNENIRTFNGIRAPLLKITSERGHTREFGFMGNLICRLVQSRSLIQSHSECPLTFIERLDLHWSYIILGNFNAITFRNYCNSKSGLENLLFRSVILTPIVIIKDMVSLVIPILLVFIEMLIRLPRRQCANLNRMLKNYDFFGKMIIEITLGSAWFITTVMQYVMKVVHWVCYKITSPLLSASVDKDWVIAQFHNKNLGRRLGWIIYGVSLLTSCALYFVTAKALSYALPAIGAGITLIALAKVLFFICRPCSIYGPAVVASGAVLLQKSSELIVKKNPSHIRTKLFDRKSRILQGGHSSTKYLKL